MSTSGPVSSVKQGSSVAWPPTPHLASSVTHKFFFLAAGISQHSNIICDVLNRYLQTKVFEAYKCLYYCKHAKNLWAGEN